MDEQRFTPIPEVIGWLMEEIERSGRLTPEDIQRARQEAREHRQTVRRERNDPRPDETAEGEWN